ncbi:MAG: HdeA/HdeB family chaperone [Pseudomonadota bacterium]
MYNLKKLFSLIVLFLVVLMSHTTIAVADESVIDITQTTCRDLLLADSDEQSHILVFHHGFVAGSDNKTSISIDTLALQTEEIKNRCIDNPAEVLMKTFMAIKSEDTSNE